MKQRMLAFRVRSGKLARISKPLPSLRPNWALIRVRFAGICNTDVEILRGYHDFRRTPGHEFVGEVVEVAGLPAQRKHWLGKRVVGEINIGCRALGIHPVCKFCRRELIRHCARRRVLGIVNHDGAFADYLTLPLENLHIVPNSITDEQAVFVEPLAAACEILDQVDVKKFSEAAVSVTASSPSSSRASCVHNSHAWCSAGSTPGNSHSLVPQELKQRKSAAIQPTLNA